MTAPYIDIHTHHPRVEYPSPTMAGIHPWDADKGLHMPDLTSCDLIGETGLDFACDVDRAAQEAIFRRHLSEAERGGKPVVIHMVKAFEETMHILREYKLQGVVIHGFIGSKEQASRCFEKGYFLSFGHRSLRSPRTREVIASAPISQIFCETDDSCDILIEDIYHKVAEIRNDTLDELRQEIEKNYIKLINRR